MKVRFIRSWKNYRVDQVIDPPSGQAKEMIRRGLVVQVGEVETAAFGSGERNAMLLRDPRLRKRGLPTPQAGLPARTPQAGR